MWFFFQEIRFQLKADVLLRYVFAPRTVQGWDLGQEKEIDQRWRHMKRESSDRIVAVVVGASGRTSSSTELVGRLWKVWVDCHKSSGQKVGNPNLPWYGHVQWKTTEPKTQQFLIARLEGRWYIPLKSRCWLSGWQRNRQRHWLGTEVVKTFC